MEPETQEVEVKAAVLSTVNWAAGLTAALALLASFGLPLDADQRANIVTLVAVFGPALVIYLRTFNTKTITPSVAKKLK